MHLRKEEMNVNVLEHLKEGKGSVEMRNFLPIEDAEGSGRTFSIATLKPGCSIGYHKHENEFEIYLVLKGQATIVEDGVTYTMKEGDMMQCKSGSSHSIENCTNEDLQFLALILFNQKH